MIDAEIDKRVTGMGGAEIEEKPARKPWVIPEVIELEVAGTALNPRVGSDGGIFQDCTHS